MVENITNTRSSLVSGMFSLTPVSDYSKINDSALREIITTYGLNILRISQSIDEIKNNVERGKEQLKSDQNKIWNLTLLIEKLKRDIDKYSKLLNNQTTEMQEFQKTVYNYIRTDEDYRLEKEYQSDLVSQEKYLNLILQLKFVENSIKNSENIEDTINIYNLFKKEILKVFEEKEILEQNLLKKHRFNENYHKELTVKMTKVEEYHKKTKFCFHCHQMVFLKDNDEVRLSFI